MSRGILHDERIFRRCLVERGCGEAVSFYEGVIVIAGEHPFARGNGVFRDESFDRF